LATRESEAQSVAAKTRAEANFRKKEERAKEGAVAMKDYVANGRVVREQMARLRALRLAKEANDAAAEKAAAADIKPKGIKAKGIKPKDAKPKDANPEDAKPKDVKPKAVTKRRVARSDGAGVP
jgi:hypothetical protein